MRNILGWFAATLGTGSLVYQCWIVIGCEKARHQALNFDFPLTSLGETMIVMVLPMAASALALILSLICIRAFSGRIGLTVALFSWLAIWLIIGNDGFRYLF